MENLRPNEQRGKAALALIWIMLAVELLMGVSNYFEYRLLSSWVDGEPVSMEAAAANDSRQLLIAILLIATRIASIVTFILWFRRAYYNLHLRVRNLQNTEGWAAGAWFIPIVNLYMPYQIMKELYVETFALMGNKKGEYPENFTTAFVGWWWFLWIATGLCGRIEFFKAVRAEDIHAKIETNILSIVSCGMGVVLCVITAKVIFDYMQLEKMRMDHESRENQLAEIGQTDESQEDANEIVLPSL